MVKSLGEIMALFGLIRILAGIGFHFVGKPGPELFCRGHK